MGDCQCLYKSRAHGMRHCSWLCLWKVVNTFCYIFVDRTLWMDLGKVPPCLSTLRAGTANHIISQTLAHVRITPRVSKTQILDPTLEASTHCFRGWRVRMYISCTHRCGCHTSEDQENHCSRILAFAYSISLTSFPSGSRNLPGAGDYVALFCGKDLEGENYNPPASFC